MADTLNEPSANTVLMVIAAILLPPLAVFLARGIGTDFWINVVLTILAWVPGVLHALWVVLAQRRV
ncbi:YqaE/Pmp3 family membrane protein [Sphingosinicellaceae bacterium]|nr:YqaE/Pmp3 family membrane protein [Sphingosinicellaceae bacterium]